MIFTPEEHRGHGYATSVTAFQTDYLLARDGIAYAYVRWNNLPSQAMFAKLGARRTREPLSGAVFHWPVGREPR
jgi:predicted GNAT family acetyltransferase